MRIGINVPNELLKRVKATDPNVNVSQICREALEVYADRSETARSFGFYNLEEMERYAVMLLESDERPLVEPDWAGYGLIDAQGWVRAVKRKEWDRFLHHYDFISNRDRKEAISCVRVADRPEGVKCFYDRKEDHEEYINLMLDNDIYYSTLECERIYNEAWLSYVLEVRRKHEEHRAAKRERILDERREAWTAITPELPPQLCD